MKCNLCGSPLSFQVPEGISLREATCSACGASQRASDLAGVILKTLLIPAYSSLAEAKPVLTSLSIFEAQSTGPIHACCEGLPGYFCSEYFDDISLGSKNQSGIRCEDLQDLSFSDNSFDLVITQDVLEHVKKPFLAFDEIFRVLKPGGFHIFTVPYHEGRKTMSRINGELQGVELKYPLVYHGDPLRREGAVVYTDFGDDLAVMLESHGFITYSICCSAWYTSDEIPAIIDEDSYEAYLKYYRTNDLCRFFTYNSWVFRSEKPVTRGK